MLERYDHQMPGRVGKYIQDDKVKPGTFEDEFLLIGSRVIENIAENTSDLWVAWARFAGYVVISPRTPQYIHDLHLPAARIISSVT